MATVTSKLGPAERNRRIISETAELFGSHSEQEREILRKSLWLAAESIEKAGKPPDEVNLKIAYVGLYKGIIDYYPSTSGGFPESEGGFLQLARKRIQAEFTKHDRYPDFIPTLTMRDVESPPFKAILSAIKPASETGFETDIANDFIRRRDIEAEIAEKNMGLAFKASGNSADPKQDAYLIMNRAIRLYDQRKGHKPHAYIAGSVRKGITELNLEREYPISSSNLDYLSDRAQEYGRLHGMIQSLGGRLPSSKDLQRISGIDETEAERRIAKASKKIDDGFNALSDTVASDLMNAYKGTVPAIKLFIDIQDGLSQQDGMQMTTSAEPELKNLRGGFENLAELTRDDSPKNIGEMRKLFDNLRIGVGEDIINLLAQPGRIVNTWAVTLSDGSSYYLDLSEDRARITTKNRQNIATNLGYRELTNGRFLVFESPEKARGEKLAKIGDLQQDSSSDQSQGHVRVSHGLEGETVEIIPGAERQDDLERVKSIMMNACLTTRQYSIVMMRLRGYTLMQTIPALELVDSRLTKLGHTNQTVLSKQGMEEADNAVNEAFKKLGPKPPDDTNRGKRENIRRLQNRAYEHIAEYVGVNIGLSDLDQRVYVRMMLGQSPTVINSKEHIDSQQLNDVRTRVQNGFDEKKF